MKNLGNTDEAEEEEDNWLYIYEFYFYCIKVIES